VDIVQVLDMFLTFITAKKYSDCTDRTQKYRKKELTAQYNKNKEKDENAEVDRNTIEHPVWVKEIQFIAYEYVT